MLIFPSKHPHFYFTISLFWDPEERLLALHAANLVQSLASNTVPGELPEVIPEIRVKSNPRIFLGMFTPFENFLSSYLLSKFLIICRYVSFGGGGGRHT